MDRVVFLPERKQGEEKHHSTKIIGFAQAVGFLAAPRGGETTWPSLRRDGDAREFED